MKLDIDPSEFRDVISGLPSKREVEGTQTNFAIVYIAIGIGFAILVGIFSESIDQINRYISPAGGGVLTQIISGVVLAATVGAVQSWVFRNQIKTTQFQYILFAAAGGFVGGLIAGLSFNLTRVGFFIGGINGMIAGGLGSYLQGKLMVNSKYHTQWFQFNAISWAIIFGLGWTISWGIYGSTGIAFGAAFILIASGISLLVFLKNNRHIEFS